MSFLSRLFHPKPPVDDHRFGFAVMGIGHIATKIAEDLRNSPHVRVTAAVSRTLDRAEKFARKHRIPHAYTYDQWEAIAHDPTIDATYLALPVAHHREFSERSFTAGKHVLCEKPMASSLADCQAMNAAAHRASRLLMLAYRLDYDPAHDELKRMLAAGELGRIEHVTSGFGFVAKPGWRLDPTLAGGGSLFDVGVYPSHALHELFGATVISSAEIVRDATTGMEMDAVWRGTLTSGASFECSSSYLRHIPDSLIIRCERGTVRMKHAYDYNRTELYLNDKLHFADKKHNPSLFRLECEHLAACAKQHTPVKSSGEGGLRDMQTIAQIEAIASSSRF